MANRSCRAEETPTGSTMEPKFELTDEQWNLISDLFPDAAVGPEGGRPQAPARGCMEGILWVLRSGARWKDVPRHFPSPTTCWRRHKEWTETGLWVKAWSRLVRKLDRAGQINHEESFADGTFSSAKKGVKRLARLNVVKAPRSWSTPMPRDFPWPSTPPVPVLMKSL